jgi:hypothetical protein
LNEKKNPKKEFPLFHFSRIFEMSHRKVKEFISTLPQFSDYSTKKSGDKSDRFHDCFSFMNKISGGKLDSFVGDMLFHTQRGQKILTSENLVKNGFKYFYPLL